MAAPKQLTIPINKLPCARHNKIALNKLMKGDGSRWHWIPKGSTSVWGYIQNEKYDKYLTVHVCPDKMSPCSMKALPKSKNRESEQLWRKWGDKIISKKAMKYKDKPLVLTLDSDDVTVIAKSPADGENQDFFLKKLA